MGSNMAKKLARKEAKHRIKQVKKAHAAMAVVAVSSMVDADDATVLVSRRIPLSQARLIRAAAIRRGRSVSELLDEFLAVLAEEGSNCLQSDEIGIDASNVAASVEARARAIPA